MDIGGSSVLTEDAKVDLKNKIEAATAAAQALRSLCYSIESRRELYFAGGIPLLTRLVTVGTISQDLGPATEARPPKSKSAFFIE